MGRGCHGEGVPWGGGAMRRGRRECRREGVPWEGVPWGGMPWGGSGRGVSWGGSTMGRGEGAVLMITAGHRTISDQL